MMDMNFSTERLIIEVVVVLMLLVLCVGANIFFNFAPLYASLKVYDSYTQKAYFTAFVLGIYALSRVYFSFAIVGVNFVHSKITSSGTASVQDKVLKEDGDKGKEKEKEKRKGKVASSEASTDDDDDEKGDDDNNDTNEETSSSTNMSSISPSSSVALWRFLAFVVVAFGIFAVNFVYPSALQVFMDTVWDALGDLPQVLDTVGKDDRKRIYNRAYKIVWLIVGWFVVLLIVQLALHAMFELIRMGMGMLYKNPSREQKEKKEAHEEK